MQLIDPLGPPPPLPLPLPQYLPLVVPVCGNLKENENCEQEYVTKVFQFFPGINFIQVPSLESKWTRNMSNFKQ